MQNLLNHIAEKISRYRRYRKTVIELCNLNDRELADIGITRCDIPNIAASFRHS
jgi:hypothetical protein